eukprot:Pgem_evm1s20121
MRDAVSKSSILIKKSQNNTKQLSPIAISEKSTNKDESVGEKHQQKLTENSKGLLTILENNANRDVSIDNEITTIKKKQYEFEYEKDLNFIITEEKNDEDEIQIVVMEDTQFFHFSIGDFILGIAQELTLSDNDDHDNDDDDDNDNVNNDNANVDNDNDNNDNDNDNNDNDDNNEDYDNDNDDNDNGNDLNVLTDACYEDDLKKINN